VGKLDPFRTQSELIQRLFKKSVLRYVANGGGHDVPRTGRDVNEAVKAAEWVIERAMLGAKDGS
jgi:hypothetical protein